MSQTKEDFNTDIQAALKAASMTKHEITVNKKDGDETRVIKVEISLPVSVQAMVDQLGEKFVLASVISDVKNRARTTISNAMGNKDKPLSQEDAFKLYESPDWKPTMGVRSQTPEDKTAKYLKKLTEGMSKEEEKTYLLGIAGQIKTRLS